MERYSYARFVNSEIGVFLSGQEAEEQTEPYQDGQYDVYPTHTEIIEALQTFLIDVSIESIISNNGQYSTNKIMNV